MNKLKTVLAKNNKDGCQIWGEHYWRHLVIITLETIPPKSTNKIRCLTSCTVLLPASAKLTRGIWETNSGEIVVLTVTLFKNIHEHLMKFKNIRGYSNGKIKLKNIQDFRRPVRTLLVTLITLNRNTSILLPHGNLTPHIPLLYVTIEWPLNIILYA